MCFTEDDYYSLVIRNKTLSSNLNWAERGVYNELSKILSEWAGDCLVSIKLSGSRAKGTATTLTSDMDIFVSLSSSTQESLREIYDSCFECLREKYYSVRKQNVSIGVLVPVFGCGSIKVDVVPARRQSQYGNDHSLYKSKKGSWVKTNIDTHISQVVNSGRQPDIVALKVWRDLNKISFPSIYLECFALEYLKGRKKGVSVSNFYHLLYSIASDIEEKVIYDPANTNNILLDELTLKEKEALSNLAAAYAVKPIYEIL